MISMEMETVEIVPDPLRKEEEEGELLEDGEIDDEDVQEKEEECLESQDVAVDVVESAEANAEEEIPVVEEEISDTDDKKRHHKRSHKRRRKRHEKEDRKSEDKKSRHKKRKAEDGSEDGGESPPSKKKKKRKRHGRDKKERESTTPEHDSEIAYPSNRNSESPPLPSEQSEYAYDTYNTANATYNDTSNYTASTYNQSSLYDASAMSNYTYGTSNEGYQQESDFSSGSDSYYSDFESHLKQYQSYKQNKDKVNGNEQGFSDEDNYYSIGYDATEKRRRRQNDGHSNRKSLRGRNGNLMYDGKARTGSSRRNQGTGSDVRRRTSAFKEDHSGDRYRHPIGSHRKFKKHNELCHHYVNGYCQLGDKCNYMHEEYPCKYFHSGTQCVNGENCKYSHDPLNEQTKAIVEKFQEETLRNSKEIEELEKVGIKPLQKPPPGMGLLPTPPAGMALVAPEKLPPPGKGRRMNKAKIPSLFDITVEPTPEFQKRIEANIRDNNWLEAGRLMYLSAVASLKMIDDDVPSVLSPMPKPGFNPPNTGAGLLPLPGLGTGLLRPPLIPNFPPPSSLLGSPPGPSPLMMAPPNAQIQQAPLPTLPPGSGTPPWIQRQKMLAQQQKEETKEFYDSFYSKSKNDLQTTNASNDESHLIDQDESERDKINNSTSDTDLEKMKDHDEDMKEHEDVIRIDDHEPVNETEIKAPDFLPAKQKALFMRIHQKSSLSTDLSQQLAQVDLQNRKGSLSESWTYSSDEDDPGPVRSHDPRTIKSSNASSSSSVQSIIKLISNKHGDGGSTVDTHLLSKVANVISMTPIASGLSKTHNATYTTNSPTAGKAMMSPPSQPHLHHRERKSSRSEDSPSHPSMARHHPLRRRLSTSELLKEPIVIPLVVKQNVDSIHATHPDPRITLSRLLSKARTEFHGSLPGFGKDVPGVGKFVGLKITLSSDLSNAANKEKAQRPRQNDPRVKVKPNDPRLRSRVSSATKSSPPHLTPSDRFNRSIPPKPAALLTKPPTPIIPSLPELNLDFANMTEHKSKSSSDKISPVSTKLSDPLARLPKLMRGNIRSSSNHAESPPKEEGPKEPPVPTIAPYDPRFITAGATSSKAVNGKPAPYDPRVITSQTPSAPAPVLYDPRSTNNDVPKRSSIQLPKLTPAPGYIAKLSPAENLPSGEAGDF